ncbi:OLC1v1008591C1 [Oldenlandia corymbosa var. corymbosa]|uniref:OLC1v1008591C1 n=1 Tax=Oldenlandia corymbosa var. corymbosa TaxID=529605 RepID=A0AAV1DMI2_OLDCO|nr:OLC1v1008591C1 [Oldenlandia corymbosa var. corymbosa]
MGYRLLGIWTSHALRAIYSSSSYPGGGKTLVGLSALNSAYTPGGSSVCPGLQSTLYRGQSTTLQHASSSGTSRRSKVSTEEIDDWVVTDDVPGGPCDGSVIPSFLGHTAYQLWNGEPRDYLTIKPAKKSLSRLHGWSGGRISASLMTELHRGIGNIGEYSWGSGTLAFLYRQLGIASRAGCTTMAGCMTLLQAWIYEYFSCFQPSKRRGRRGVVGWPRARDWTPVSYKGPRPIHSRLQQIRTQLDAMTEQEVEWEPFGRDQAAAHPRTIFSGWIMYHDFQEPYMPERVLRQLGYVQYIPRAPLTPVTQFRGKNAHKYFVERPIAETCNCWVRFPESECISLSHCVPVSSLEWMREMEKLTRVCIDDLKKLDVGLGEKWDTRLDDVIFRYSQAP